MGSEALRVRECPRCLGVELAEYPAAEGVGVDYCQVCRGLWCDDGELEKLIAAPLTEIAPLPFQLGEPDGPTCPSCRPGLMHARSASSQGDSVQLFDCSRCRGTWLDGGVLQRLQQLLRDRRLEAERVRPRPRVPKPKAAPKPFVLDDKLPFNSLTIQAATLPLVMVIGLFFAVMGAPFFFRLVLHEFGHAVVAWLSGAPAIPVILGGYTRTFERSVLFGLIVLLGLVFSIVFHGKKRKFFEASVSGIMLVFYAYLTLWTTVDRANMWISYAGIAGEIVLATWILVGFYYPSVERLRWDFWRFIAIFPASLVYCQNFVLWVRALDDLTLLPMGSAVGDESLGDLNKLIDLWNWTPQQIADSYWILTLLCGGLVLIHYVFFLWRAYQNRQVAGVRDAASS